jgi:hypothetical protein
MKNRVKKINSSYFDGRKKLKEIRQLLTSSDLPVTSSSDWDICMVTFEVPPI